jgi:hypothetical protein
MPESEADPQYIQRQEFDSRFDRVDRELQGLARRIEDLAERAPTRDTIQAAVAATRRADPAVLIASLTLALAVAAMASGLIFYAINDVAGDVERLDASVAIGTSDRYRRSDAKHDNDRFDRIIAKNRDVVAHHQREAEHYFGRVESLMGSDGTLESIEARLFRLEGQAMTHKHPGEQLFDR